MVPERVDGLLLSGRNISGTHMAHSNYRAMPICVGIGEACGIAAAISVTEGIVLRELDVRKIQAKVSNSYMNGRPIGSVLARSRSY